MRRLRDVSLREIQMALDDLDRRTRRLEGMENEVSRTEPRDPQYTVIFYDADAGKLVVKGPGGLRETFTKD